MYSYASRIPPRDRWAIAAYIRALQLSQHASAAELPAEDQGRLERADSMSVMTRTSMMCDDELRLRLDRLQIPRFDRGRASVWCFAWGRG